MKKLFWLSVGVLGGFVLAHKVSQTERGAKFLDSVNTRVEEFQTAATEAFEQREGQLRNALEKFQDELQDFNK